MTARACTRRVSVPACCPGRPAAQWLAALAPTSLTANHPARPAPGNSRLHPGKEALMSLSRTASMSEREKREIQAANASGRTPVVFVHGLWLLPGSWASRACRER